MVSNTASERYDMPIVFGSSHVPMQTRVPFAEAAIISFVTERTAAEALLPPGFEAPARPVVSVAFIGYTDVDYLGGRGYNEVVVSISSVFKGEGDPLEAPFVLVLWVDQVGALLTGREFQGFPKLMGELEFRSEDAARSWACREYGTTLLEGGITGLTDIPPLTLEKINRAAASVVSLSWKHIPSLAGPPDADYPTKSVMRWNYEQAWTGKGELRFFEPAFAQAPYGWRAARALSKLPVVEYRPAFVGAGPAVIDRTAMSRLHSR